MKQRHTLPRSITDLAMTSREIAQLTGKRHDHVLRDIRYMLIELLGEGGLPKFQAVYLHEQNGQQYPCFSLPKDLTITLLSGYNVRLRYAVIKRWLEMEAQVAAQASPRTYIARLHDLIEAKKEAEAARFQTYAEALRQAADTAEREEAKRKTTNNRSLTC